MAYKQPVNPEVVRIQNMIQNDLMEINKRYTDIGRIVKLQCLDQVSNEDVKRMAAEIDKLLEELKNLNTQLDTVNGLKTCVNPSCCCKIELNMAFCPNCGTKQPLVQQAMPQQPYNPYQQPYNPYQQPAPAPMPAPAFRQQPAPMPAPNPYQQPAPAPMPAPVYQQPAPAPAPAPAPSPAPEPVFPTPVEPMEPEAEPANAVIEEAETVAEAVVEEVPEAVVEVEEAAEEAVPETVEEAVGEVVGEVAEEVVEEPEPERIVKPFEMPKPVAVPKSIDVAPAPKPEPAPIPMPTTDAPRNGGYIFCSQCGNKEPEGTRFCSQCGSPV